MGKYKHVTQSNHHLVMMFYNDFTFNWTLRLKTGSVKRMLRDFYLKSLETSSAAGWTPQEYNFKNLASLW